ncbi:unnamed protein product, partial [Nesidiocoris tenuis]
ERLLLGTCSLGSASIGMKLISASTPPTQLLKGDVFAFSRDKRTGSNCRHSQSQLAKRPDDCFKSARLDGKFCNEDLFRSYSNVLNSRFLKPATLQKMFILNFYLRNYHQGQCLETNDASRLLGNCPYESNVSWIFASWLQQAQIKPLVQTVDCDNLGKLLKLQSRLGNYEIIKPGRSFIKEGELQKLSRKEIQPRYLILAPVWIQDKRTTMCQVCTSEFTVTFRRHHCRCCGRDSVDDFDKSVLFRLTHSGQQPLIFSAPSEHTAKMYQNLITPFNGVAYQNKLKYSKLNQA